MANNGGACGFVALNSTPLAKTKLFAVVAVNAPGISKVAFLPNTIPLGLIKNKFGLELPYVPSFPKISEGLLPVTRAKIFWISALGLKKYASLPSLILNSRKL